MDEVPTSGEVPITDELVDRLAAEAERGYPVAALRKRQRVVRRRCEGGHVVFYCPTSGEMEFCPAHARWEHCCDRPDLHVLGWDGALTPGERETPS